MGATAGASTHGLAVAAAVCLVHSVGDARHSVDGRWSGRLAALSKLSRCSLCPGMARTYASALSVVPSARRAGPARFIEVTKLHWIAALMPATPRRSHQARWAQTTRRAFQRPSGQLGSAANPWHPVAARPLCAADERGFC